MSVDLPARYLILSEVNKDLRIAVEMSGIGEAHREVHRKAKNVVGRIF